MEDAEAFSTPLRHHSTSGLSPKTSKNQKLSVVSLIEETLLARSAEDGCPKQDDFFGLPSRVLELYAEQRGVTQLYDWQNECLNLTMRSNGANLVYSLPTSGGKTLVRSLTSMGLELGFWVEEYAGNRGRIPPVKRRGSHSVLMATIEKAHSIVNALIDVKNLSDLGLVIVDELHMIGEGGSRGACLEMTLTKIRLVSPQLSSESCEELMADRLIHRRMVNFSYTKQMLSRDPDHLVGLVTETLLGYSVHPVSDQSDQLPSTKRFSCLVFCPTKVHCENTARMLAELLPPAACFPAPRTDDPTSSYDAEKMTERRAELLRNLCIDALPDPSMVGKTGELRTCCPVLEMTVPRGVAYHHGGLTQEERTLLEEGFADGTLSVLCCTSTLAAGVNLPARRVIIRKPYIGSSFITGSQYQQIVGRAGRAGFDSVGESVIILQSNDRSNFAQMLASIPQIGLSNASPSDTTSAGLCCSSLLYDNGKGMRQFLLSLIGLQIAMAHEDLLRAVRASLFSVQARYAGCDRIEEVVNAELHTLIGRGLVIAISNEATSVSSPARTVHGDVKKLSFQATKLGRAAVRGGLDTDQVGPLLSDLRAAARALNTSGPLHLLYLVAPPDAVDQIQVDWTVLYERISLLPATEANIITLLGFPEGYLLWKAVGHPIRKSRARQLYSAGFCTLKDIASAEPRDLTTRLAPFLSRRKANDLIQAARMLISERADALRLEAAELLTGVHSRGAMSQVSDDLIDLSVDKQQLNNCDDMSTPIPTPAEEDEDLFA
ncbi:Helicase POLQ protein [Fasciola hepatica]|uniref:Helicase POLQ protein n=1 Tax=Fasciola hepatica TaxID=6192 RepID=A0A4E0RHV4_FASHE|nr:Helicase POLQ protein [Fasciola hepatica]